MPSVLLVDDDAQLCTALAASLQAQRFTVTWRCTGQEAIALAQDHDFDVAVCDLNMPSMSGIELCTRLRELRPDLPVVVLTAFGSYETAVEAIRAGAYDFLSKPVKVDVLAIAVNRAVSHHQLTTEVKRLRSEADRHTLTKEFTGGSLAMRRVQDTIARVAPTEALVLITGESGTGKEVAARAIHNASQRAGKPFVAINCAALPENLLESELFGHQRGAFTDAKEARLGLLREAAGGTVFLDEIGDMPLGLQPKLLRVIQERKVRPVGASNEIPIDVRFVAATNADLEAAIEAKRFREDLYFRLAVVSLDLPPLRARGDADILALAQRFVVRFAQALGKQVRGLAPATAKRLLEYPWPGNVRELQNAMEHAVTLTAFDEVLPQDLPERVSRHRPTPTVANIPVMPDELLSLDEIERRYILHVLRAVGGNKSAAARILRIERKTLYRKFAEWDASAPANDNVAE